MKKNLAKSIKVEYYVVKDKIKGEMFNMSEDNINLNEFLYPDDLNYIVTTDIGGFKKGDSIKGLSIAKIIEKMCCYEPLKTDIEYLNLLDVPKLWNSGITGKGVRIGLFGMGIATNDSIANVKKSFDASIKQEVIVNSNSNAHDVGVLSNIASKKYGIAYDAEIYVSDIKIINGVDTDDTIFTERFKASMDWFISQEVDIISASVIFDKVNKNIFREYMDKLNNNNIILVTAMGNTRNQGDHTTNVSYHNVITIGAVDKNRVYADFQTSGEYMTFTCFGVDVPGYSIELTEVKNSGTSFATPYAAGLIACLIQQAKDRKLKLTARQIRDIIARNCCEDLGSIGKDNRYGYGLIKGGFIPTSIKSDYDIKLEEDKMVATINYTLPDVLYSDKQYNFKFYISPSIVNYRKVSITTTTNDIITVKEKDYEFIITTIKEGQAKINIVLETGESKHIEIDVIKTKESSIEECKALYGVDIVHKAGFQGQGIKIAYCCSGIDLSKYTANVKGGEKFNASFGDIYVEGSRYKDATACASVLNYLVPKAEVYVIKVKNEWGGLGNDTMETAVYEYILSNKFDIVVWDFVLQSHDSNLKDSYLNKINDANIIQIRNSFSNLSAPKTMNRDDYIGGQVIGAIITNHKNSIVSEYMNDIPYFDATKNEFNLGTDRNVKNLPWALIAVIALYKNQNQNLNTATIRQLLIENAKKLSGQTTFQSNYKNGLVQAAIL